jgi:hypothetical protein
MQPTGDRYIVRKKREGRYVKCCDENGFIEYIIKLDKNKKQKIVYKIQDSKIIAVRYMKYGKYEFSINKENNNYTVMIQNNGEGIVKTIAYMINYMKQTPVYNICLFNHTYEYPSVSQVEYKILPDFTNTDVMSYALMIKPDINHSYEIVLKYLYNTGFGEVYEYNRADTVRRVLKIVDHQVRDEHIYQDVGGSQFQTYCIDRIIVRIHDVKYNRTDYEYSLDKKLKSIYIDDKSRSCKITVVGENKITISGNYPVDSDNINFALSCGKTPKQLELFKY